VGISNSLWKLFATTVIFAGIAPASAIFASTKGIPARGPAVVLFNGSDLSGFDTFIQSKGLNNDPDHVFQVEHGMVHVSGTEMGYIITKQDYQNYYLKAEFKWGEGTFAPREGQARDSGILYNIQGEQKVWPRSVEFQINEGCTGDFWLTDGAALTGKDGQRVTGPDGKAVKIDRFNKGPWKNVVGYRDPVNEVEKPHGQWNVLELVNQNGHVKQYVNGKLVNEGTDAFPSSGKILFQSEGAEVFFRNMKLYPLK
jgi:3-keto-disaccharide hydrolase